MDTVQSSPAPQTASKIDISELTAFRHYDSFNVFFYSKKPSGKTNFLLYKTYNSEKLTHFHGYVSIHDPCVIFAAVREVITMTKGLFYRKNIQYFLKHNPLAMDPSAIKLENKDDIVRPQKGFTPAIDELAKLLCNCNYQFQDESNTVTYFIEFPILNNKLINDFTMEEGIDIEFESVAVDDIINSQSDKISPDVTVLFRNAKLTQYVQEFFIENKEVEIINKYALICCEPLAINYMRSSLHHSFFKKHGESWKLYKAYEGHLPSDEELKNLKAIVIPGSGQAAYNQVPWYKDLFECIRKIHLEYTHINLLGICFGAQASAQALGGKVQRMERSFIRGGETLQIDKDFFKLKYVKDLKIDTRKPLVIAQAHGDHIVKLPKEAILYASSENTRVEIYTIGEKMLCFQGHPDYNEAWTAGANYRIATKWGMEVADYDDYEEEFVAERFPEGVRHSDILKICYNFLKNN